jgi:ATP-dependent Clp protease ATP-binding subunit ClpB
MSQALTGAEQVRKDLRDDFLSVEHLLLALHQKLGVTSEQLLGALRAVQRLSRGLSG